MCSLIFFIIKSNPIREKISLTIEELKYYNRKKGRPTYVVINGDVDDISKCRHWKNGEHPKAGELVKGGLDLTDALSNFNHGIKHLKHYPIMGHMKEGSLCLEELDCRNSSLYF